MTRIISTSVKNKVPTAQVIFTKEVNGKKVSVTKHLKATSQKFYTDSRGMIYDKSKI